jgi:ketosteroid isomerase-like protein
MSRENVEALRRGFEAMNCGDMSEILGFVDPDFETVIPSELSAEPDTYRGHEGVRRYFETFRDAMGEIRFEVDRVWDAGDKVVVAVRLTAKGKQTGIPVTQELAQVWTIRDGKAIRADNYVTLSQALESVGLTE